MTIPSDKSPTARFIPLCVPEIQGNAWAYVKECLDTNWVSSVGSYVDRFERDLAEYVGTRYAVATVNGTSALHTALLVAGIGPDDEVLTSTLTFIAPANAIRYVGAWPVFIDADPHYWQMDPEKVVRFLDEECVRRDGSLYNKTTHRPVKAILPVHLLGHPVDMDPIRDAAERYGLVIIEDATESLGATYKDRMAGTLGQMACFSFNGNKVITSGGGGMIVTDREDWATKAKYLTTQAKDDPIEYVHHEIGYNYRLPNLLAALGVAQLECLDEYLRVKRRIAATYAEAFARVPGITGMSQAEWAGSIFWMYTVLVDAERYPLNSRQLLRRLGERGIQSRPLWQPIHLSRPHRSATAYRCSVSETLFRQALSLPCSVGLSREDQQFVCEIIANPGG